MRVGELRERITVERATTVSDGAGGQTVTWTGAYTLWANVTPVRGREQEHLGRLATVETYLITVRHGPSITTKDRILWREKALNITAAQDREGTRQWLTIEAEAGLGTP